MENYIKQTFLRNVFPNSHWQLDRFPTEYFHCILKHLGAVVDAKSSGKCSGSVMKKTKWLLKINFFSTNLKDKIEAYMKNPHLLTFISSSWRLRRLSNCLVRNRLRRVSSIILPFSSIASSKLAVWSRVMASNELCACKFKVASALSCLANKNIKNHIGA